MGAQGAGHAAHGVEIVGGDSAIVGVALERALIQLPQCQRKQRQRARCIADLITDPVDLLLGLEEHHVLSGWLDDRAAYVGLLKWQHMDGGWRPEWLERAIVKRRQIGRAQAEHYSQLIRMFLQRAG